MRTILNQNKTKTISITSGKGGVGKTSLTANIAYCLAKKGKKVLIFDGDLGMANIDIMFGVKPQYNIMDVIKGEKTLSEIVLELDHNISLIPGGSGVVELNRLNAFERRTLVESVTALEETYDYLLIDTAPGISDNVLYLNAAAQMSAVVITPDPSSLADSYALIKTLHKEYKENKFAIICNQVRDEMEGLALFNRFNEVVNRFLYIGLDYWGSVPQDQMLKRCTQSARLIMKQDPTAAASVSMNQVSMKLERSLMKIESKAGLQFFWDQVIGVA